MRGWALVVMVSAACSGDSVIPPDTAHSGTRLKLSWYEFEDGLRTWSTDIRDSKLDAPCTPIEWSDGVVRCTPQPAVSIAFSDDKCQVPFIIGSPAYGYVAESSTCDDASLEPARPKRWFVATGELTTFPVAYSKAAGYCSMISPPPRDYEFHGRPAKEASSPDLVAITYGYQGEGRLRIETMQGSDGLLLPMRPYDSRYEAACDNFNNLHFNTDGMADATSVPCVFDARETSLYVDASCETPAALASSSCDHPEIVSVGGAGPCREYWTVGDEAVAAVFQSPGSCLPAQTNSPVVLRANERVEPLTLTRARQSADGRANLIYIGDADTRIREREIFYDTALDTECQLTQYGVDWFLCVPISRTSGTEMVFTDDACTQPIYVTWANNTTPAAWTCVPQTPPKYSWDGGSEARPIGEALPGPFYAMTNGSCAPMNVINATAYALGPPAAMPFMRVSKVFD